MTKTLESETARTTTQARKPLQKRSRDRVERLLDATDGLLAARDVADVGIYDIAERAGAPPASVYHFFPTREAAFVALAERYLSQLFALSREPFPQEDVQNWPDLLALSQQRTIAFYDAHPVFMKLFFSGSVIADVRKRDLEYVERQAARSYHWMDRYFHMPYLPDAPKKFSVILAVFDGLCMASYARHGKVTADYAEEMTRVIVAYCRTFLPEHLPRREHAADPAA